jgi:hypothetical protein
MELWFNALYGSEQSGYVPVVVYPKEFRTKGMALPEWKAMPLNRYRWFQWPLQAEAMAKFCKRHKDEDVYVTVGLCSERSNKKEFMLPLNVIHCDADDAAPNRFAVEPTWTIESSPGRWQLYWQLKEALPVEQAEDLAKRVYYSQKSHGADSGWAANKLMRVPGTANTKPGYPKDTMVRIVQNGRPYTYKELDAAFAGVPVGNKLAAQDIPLPTERIEKNAILQLIFGASAVAMETFTKPAGENGGTRIMRDRSLALWSLLCEGFRLHLTREQVYWLGYHSANNKYAQDGRPDLELWRDVLRAENQVDSDTFVFVDDDPDSEPLEYTAPPGVCLLQPEERMLVRTNTFIDLYLDWARTKTLADHNYHRANAMTILSTLLSEYGYAVPQHGKLGLEMWFMVLGVTTRSYKTTAAKMMLRIIASVGQERQFPYELESDASPEALVDALATRGDISSLYHVDEAHATVGDAKGGKGYMSGLLPVLTKLYDGKVPGVNRIGRQNTKQSSTHFTLSMLGVPGKMTETLTREDFASGFLARFLFVLGTPAPRDPESRWLNQAPEDLEFGTDAEFGKVLMFLRALLSLWDKKVQKEKDRKLAIRVADDAWARWNQLVLDLDEISEKAFDPEAVQPTAERTSVAVHKLSCLLAMADGKDVVQMDHMITAIQYAEGWYDNMTTMSNLVYENRWARQVQDLIKWVSAADKRSISSAYKQFSGFKPKEFEEMVQAGVQQGQIVVEFSTGTNGQTRFLRATK